MVMNPLLAYESGQQNAFDTADRFRTMKASRQAGNALAQGDYGAASSALYGSGMLNEGFQVQRAGQQDQQRREDLQRESQERDEKAKAQKAQTALTLAQELAKIPEEQRYAAFQSRQAFLQQAGVPPEDFANARPEDFTDEALAFAMQEAEKQLELVKASDGSYSVVDMSTGTRVGGYERPRDPLDEELKRARIGLVGAQTAKAARPPASGGGRSSPAAKLPPGFILD